MQVNMHFSADTVMMIGRLPNRVLRSVTLGKCEFNPSADEHPVSQSDNFQEGGLDRNKFLDNIIDVGDITFRLIRHLVTRVRYLRDSK